MISRPASPVTMQEFTDAFERLGIQLTRIERVQGFVIRRTEEHFETVTQLAEEVRNHLIGAPAPFANQPGAPAPFVNQPGAFPRPAGASGKNGFMQFLIARMPQLEGQEREDLWRTTSEIMRLTIADMRELDGVANVDWGPWIMV